MDSQRRQQPEWHRPTGGMNVGLVLNNSLKVGTNEPFIPQKGKLVNWYTCGPTVYDSAHFGHARNYVTFDILQRIVRDYFHYDVFYCMNITDIDDKIILRSRRNYLFQEYVQQNPKITSEVLAELTKSWEDYIEGLRKKMAQNLKAEEKGEKNKKEIEAERSLLEERITLAQSDLVSLKNSKINDDSLPFLEKAEDALSAMLDQKKGMTMDSELVKKLCDEHSKKFEKDFFDDMQKLGVRMPDVLVRVSEYVPQVVDMVQKIIQNGFAYESDGSVYFDSFKFANDPNHHYGKLEPWKIGNNSLFAEGEGALSAASGGRKADSDFALWKKSKAGEPSWPSPWGQGRPGWHIECSAMAADILGDVLDVHCGGEDLKFPHHDNELAQSEAYFGHDQWVNYFLHSGHLHIDGLKMSKSLKNFITIKSALSESSPRQMRMLFLLKAWDRQMNYQRKNPMQEVDAKLKIFTNFFLKVKAMKEERLESKSAVESWNQKDKALHQALLDIQVKVDSALRSNFDTPLAVELLLEIVNKSNVYLSNNSERKYLVLSKVMDYVSRMMSIFGIDFSDSTSSNSESGPQQKEDIARPFAKAIAEFRNKVRDGAKAKEAPGYFLGLCDDIRDNVMPGLGVKLVDDDQFGVYFVDQATLIAEREKAQQAKKEAIKSKKENTLRDRQKKLTNWEQAKLSSKELIKQDFGIEINSVDEIPAKTPSGEDISVKKKKLITQAWTKQIEANKKLEIELSKNPNFLVDLQSEVELLKKEIADLG